MHELIRSTIVANGADPKEVNKVLDVLFSVGSDLPDLAFFPGYQLNSNGAEVMIPGSNTHHAGVAQLRTHTFDFRTIGIPMVSPTEDDTEISKEAALSGLKKALDQLRISMIHSQITDDALSLTRAMMRIQSFDENGLGSRVKVRMVKPSQNKFRISPTVAKDKASDAIETIISFDHAKNLRQKYLPDLDDSVMLGAGVFKMLYTVDECFGLTGETDARAKLHYVFSSESFLERWIMPFEGGAPEEVQSERQSVQAKGEAYVRQRLSELCYISIYQRPLLGNAVLKTTSYDEVKCPDWMVQIDVSDIPQDGLSNLQAMAARQTANQAERTSADDFLCYFEGLMMLEQATGGEVLQKQGVEYHTCFGECYYSLNTMITFFGGNSELTLTSACGDSFIFIGQEACPENILTVKHERKVVSDFVESTDATSLLSCERADGPADPNAPLIE